MSSKSGIIRAIYLYVVSLVAIFMIIFSTADLVNLALKQWIFTNADKAYDYRYHPPTPMLEDSTALMKKLDECGESCELTTAEQTAIDQWHAEFVEYQEDTKRDYQKYERQNSAVRDLSFLIVAIPAFLFHWRLVKRDQKAKSA